MRRLIALAVVLLATVAFVPMVGADGGRPFSTELTGAAEVRAAGAPTAQYVINESTS